MRVEGKLEKKAHTQWQRSIHGGPELDETSKQKSFVAADACRWLGVHHGPGTADWWCLVKA